MQLPDINVWLALTFQSHQHHVAAKWWLDGLSDNLTFCRITQQGFLRLATNRKVFAREAVTLVGAWQKYDSYQRDPRISFTEEPPLIEVQWRGFTQGQTFSPQLWNDAYLAAFAVTGNFNLVTFDGGFRQFSTLHCTILS